MKLYVFGNEDLPEDNQAIKISNKLRGAVNNVEFIFVKPNEDLPFWGNDRVVIMDSVWGIEQVTVIEEDKADKLLLSPRTSVHDFDLGFQLKYLKKLGKLVEVTIIGLPISGQVNYEEIQSILRKLVAQDMQGS